MLDDAALLVALRRHWDYTGKDEDVAHEIYHDDAVLEFPQSGERFEGVENFREWRRQYPARLRFHTRRITHRADLVVVENLISYDGAALDADRQHPRVPRRPGRARADLHHGAVAGGGMALAVALGAHRGPAVPGALVSWTRRSRGAG